MSHAANFLPFAKPCLSRAEIDEVVQCLESGWIATGPRVKAFEEALATFLGAQEPTCPPFVLGCIHATGGLYMALCALGIGPGDEVITSPLTFAATANVIAMVGATPVFVDVQEDSYNLDLEAAKRALTSRTKAVIPVHFAGHPVSLSPLYEWAKEASLWVIEDAAHAIGTTGQDGKPIGFSGHIQVFSFHPNKTLTTGEGGAVVVHDAQLYDKLLPLCFHGIDRPTSSHLAPRSLSDHHDVITPALKFNMTDIQGALGIHQMHRLPYFLSQRRAGANYYFEHLKDIPYLKLPADDPGHSWHLYAPRVQHPRLTRDEVREKLKENRIGTGLHYTPVHLFSYYRKTYGYHEGNFPVAEAIGQEIFSLPLFPDMTMDDYERVVKTLREVLQ